MMPNEERDFRHNIISELRGIRKAMEKMAKNGLVVRVVVENSNKKESNRKEG